MQSRLPNGSSSLFELGQEAIDTRCCAIQCLLWIYAVANIFEGREKDIFQLQVTGRHRAKDSTVAGFVDTEEISIKREGPIFFSILNRAQQGLSSRQLTLSFEPDFRSFFIF